MSVKFENSGFTKEVAKYFMNFLETDFKKRRVPKRNTISKTFKGIKCAFDLEKYPELKKDLLKAFNSGFKNENFTITRKKYTTNLPDSLLDYTAKKAQQIDQKSFDSLLAKSVEIIDENANKYKKEIDQYLENSINDIKLEFSRSIILPLLDELDKPLENLNLADTNGKYQLETDIVDTVFAEYEVKIKDIISQHFLKSIDLVSELECIFTKQDLIVKIVDFFKDYAVSDAFNDFYNIHRNSQLIDKSEIYLYFFEIALNQEKFPLFYASLNVEKDENKFVLNFDQRLYVNTKAVEYISQEYNQELEKKDSLAGVFDRIIYLGVEESLSSLIETYIRKLENYFELNNNIDTQDPGTQKSINLLINLTNKGYFYVFDKSDESLINDYEEILDNSEILELFNQLISNFVLVNPKKYDLEVDDEWDKQDIPTKLITESPVPLNEEQKQVLIALDKPDCKLLILDGPPGTGKSHTITAIICRALLNEQSVLVLSDKKEALDVVEEKISSTLNKVRTEDNFQNPILRLGKAGGQFSKIINPQTLGNIKDYYKAFKSNFDEHASHKQRILNLIKENLNSNINFYKDLKIEDIQFYMSAEAVELNQNESDIFNELLNYFNTDAYLDEQKINQILEDSKLIAVLKNYISSVFPKENFKELQITSDYSADIVSDLAAIIGSIEQMKLPIVGYFFSGSDLDKLNLKIKSILPFIKITTPQENIEKLRNFKDIFVELFKVTSSLQQISNAFSVLIENREEIIQKLEACAIKFLESEKLLKYNRSLKVKEKLEYSFNNEPSDVFSALLSELEELTTVEMAHFLDKRLVEYATENGNELNNLRSIIKQKQKFPRNTFTNLKKAFPCILAGIRDYAEYIPLDKDLFDLIVIDEASQVSIAQSLPALIRGKKIVILGDDKQFSNVKSNNASSTINQQYKHRIEQDFKASLDSKDEDGFLNKIKQNFDIKNSVLKFCRFISNYDCMLKKHFRCYPEVISYSDKHFYNNSLQAMKIRGKKIEDVIKFDVIEDDGKFDKSKNTNSLEVDFIIDKLNTFHEQDLVQTLGIITPHREQVTLLYDSINELPIRDWLFEKCKLKIMTFDTCQGEEMDYIFYSMVATEDKDMLMYIFPKDFNLIDAESDGTLKSQRLNVGFSRAKECIHFVLSKPIESFSGEIKNALLHFKNELETAKNKIMGGTDESSGMEHKIQHYFYETKFYKENKDKIEFIPQFELGKYLKQLDKRYKHPEYKVDFLLIFNNQKIVIEYDGFKEHFTNWDEVNSDNYEFYMSDKDIYRQKILEGYGYKFLRINRFNIGADPIETLNSRLENLVKKNSKIRR